MCECDDFSCYTILYFIGAFIITYGIIISNFIESFNYFKYDYENNEIISEINNNINGYLIESISFRKTCHGDEEKVIIGIWDGTVKGCDCDGNLFKELCTDDQIKSGCKSSYPIAPINYLIFNSSYICAKKSKIKYKDLIKTNQVVSKGNSCPLNYKLCGILDTLGRKLCVKNGESCPINNITIQNQILNELSKISDDNFLIDLLNEDNYNFNNNKVVDNNNTQLIAILKVTQYKPCINPREKYWDYHYILEYPDKRCDTTIKDNNYDERYKIIPNLIISKLQLYNENSITSKLKDIDESTLNKIENDEVFLFNRNFLGFNIKDLDNSNFNFEKLLHYQNKSNKSFEAQNYFSYIILGSLAGFFILLFVNEISIKCFSFKAKPFGKFLIIIFMLGSCFSSIFYLVTYCIIFDSVKKIKSILSIKGSDEITNELINLLIEENYSNYIYSLIMVILSVFAFCGMPAIVIVLAFIVIECLFKDSDTNE